jgi:hypothetical protein
MPPEDRIGSTRHAASRPAGDGMSVMTVNSILVKNDQTPAAGIQIVCPTAHHGRVVTVSAVRPGCRGMVRT